MAAARALASAPRAVASILVVTASVGAGAWATIASARDPEPLPPGVRVENRVASLRAAASTPLCVDGADVVAWWAGEDGVAAEIGPDAVGAPGFTDAVVGRGFELDGATVLTAAGVDPVDAGVSVDAWVRPVQTGLTHAILSRWDFPSTDDAARSYSLVLSPNGTLAWETDETTLRRPLDVRSPTTSLFDGDFHHVAGTWDATASTIYVDGVAVATEPSQGGSLNAATTTAAGIGSRGGLGSSIAFTGAIDEPTVWRRALLASEVSTIFGNGPGGRCVIDPQEQAKLVAPDAAFLDRFGTWVDIDGDTAVVGAILEDGAGFDSGAAYVFTRTGATWSFQQKVVASDGAGGDQFGISVAVDGDTIVVGANLADQGAISSTGAAYVFTRSGAAWTQQAILEAPDAALDDRFGFAVALSGDTAVVGSIDDDDRGVDSGSAYVFTRAGTTWTTAQKLTASDGQALDRFGYAVAFDGDAIAVGAPRDDDNGVDSGSAYVFANVGIAWTEDTKLLAADGSADDRFGTDVGISGSSAIVGAHQDDDAGPDSGSAYVFSRSANVWSPAAKLVPVDGAAGDWFGGAVDIEGGIAVVGSRNDDDTGENGGSGYIYQRLAAGWNEQGKITASDGAPFDAFGGAVAMSGLSVIVASELDDAPLPNSGSAYVFTL